MLRRPWSIPGSPRRPRYKVRLYLDQMFRVEMTMALRSGGHDVIRASEAGHDRADDANILSYCILEKRVLVTLDGHFGDWAILPLKIHPGVVRIRIHPPVFEVVVPRLMDFLSNFSEDQLANRLVILGVSRTRWVQTSP